VSSVKWRGAVSINLPSAMEISGEFGRIHHNKAEKSIRIDWEMRLKWHLRSRSSARGGASRSAAGVAWRTWR